MSWVFMLSIVVLLAAIVLVEVRAIRIGDEREHHAPGYAFVMGGLIVIGFGIAAAVSEHVAIALLASSAGLLSVVLGATRHREATAH
jgi:small-conductance mechanosensitive channel